MGVSDRARGLNAEKWERFQKPEPGADSHSVLFTFGPLLGSPGGDSGMELPNREVLNAKAFHPPLPSIWINSPVLAMRSLQKKKKKKKGYSSDRCRRGLTCPASTQGAGEGI
jgi:hypothetical protein